jgi:hypothetical protein
VPSQFSHFRLATAVGTELESKRKKQFVIQVTSEQPLQQAKKSARRWATLGDCGWQSVD